MYDLGRTLIFLGLLLVVAGAVILALNRLHLPLGRLPGDLNWRGRGWSVSFPLATSILVSIVLSLLLWAVSRFRR
jgi:ribose/xylose/arabinose/galactoside ABC-type transport system permease subunit